MKKYLIVKADTNDADYVSKKEPITDEQLELIKPVIEAIKKFKPYPGKVRDYGDKSPWIHRHNYPNYDVREDLGEKTPEQLYGHIEGFSLFDENFIPYDEYGIHTIESIELLEVINETKLL